MASDIIKDLLVSLAAILFFPGGLFLLLCGLLYEWIDRKLLAQLQNRIGPRWFQPLADVIKLLAKEEVVPEEVDARLFIGLPIVALAGGLTAALYVPFAGLAPSHSFNGDLIVTIYLLSLLSLCLGLAGSNTLDRFSLVGATRTLTQLFSYEAPFLLALLGPAFAAGSWQIQEIATYTETRWLLLSQPLGFLVAVIGLMGKLELPPLDAPEAETEIVAGALTEYSGRGLAIFRLSKGVTLILGLTLIAAFYLGGVSNPAFFFLKTIALLLIIVGLKALFARLRIDQSVGLWWRYGTLLVLIQWLGMFLWGGVMT
ncbi:MAG TPA: NADH-quinone oxidoreductase subunit H [Anaerolineae bacterium]|nr:NADH-quinone oxidoreductase subunit H [Anaerolineae bacterium]